MRLYQKFTYLFLLIIFLPPLKILAQGPPIQTDTPIMLGVQGRGIRMFGKWIHKATLLHNGNKIYTPQNTKINIWITTIAIPYNIFNDKFQLGVVLPFMSIQMNRLSSSVSNSGIGDMKVFAKYLLYQQDSRNKTFRVASKVGVKLPSGNDKVFLPLGSGSTDYFFSTVAGWIAGRIGIYAEGIYRLNTVKGNLNYGNAFGYNLAFGYRFLPTIYNTYPSPQLNGFLEINGWTNQKNELNQRKVNDSGGTTIFISPGLQYIGGRKWLLEVSLQLPFINKLNGTQLRIDWTFTIGTRILLF